MIIVQKFGGTSLSTPSHLKRVASLIKKEVELGYKVIVVVSAMDKFTDILADYISNFPSSETEYTAESDVVLSAGEQISAGLLSLYLLSIGIKARSWMGWQLPITTDAKHTKANILKINQEHIEYCLSKNIIPVIAGFQGIEKDNQRITTIGRGGSDISAVETAISINADRCDIYTDVDGVYTADPNLVPHANKLSIITYDEMLEMSAMGAKVLHARAVERAMQSQIKLQVLSSFNNISGTLLVRKEERMRNELVTSVAYNNDEACLTIETVEQKNKIFSLLAEAHINVNIIVQNFNSHSITFTVPKSDLTKTIDLLKEYKVSFYEKVSIVSIIGIGMLTNSGVACKMFAELEKNNIKILAITTSEIKISVILHEEYRELAVRLLHTAYALDKAQ